MPSVHSCASHVSTSHTHSRYAQPTIPPALLFRDCGQTSLSSSLYGCAASWPMTPPLLSSASLSPFPVPWCRPDAKLRMHITSILGLSNGEESEMEADSESEEEWRDSGCDWEVQVTGVMTWMMRTMKVSSTALT